MCGLNGIFFGEFLCKEWLRNLMLKFLIVWGMCGLDVNFCYLGRKYLSLFVGVKFGFM